ncbi:MAG: ACP S-malonyltransferase [Gammaproteobacteria bacterium]|nr:ACP S-malonyltransferase [Gammaproteobacteria bacterium]
MDFAYIFPGQGSQSIGMMKDLSTQYPEIKQIFEQGSDVLQLDLWKLATLGPEEELNRTENTQPVMLCACMAVHAIFHECFSATPRMLAGHSFGEYTALVCAKVFNFEAALPLAKFRGQVMQQAVPEGQGAMAAVLGLETEVLNEICEQSTSEEEVVEAVNFNAPGQTVLAGSQKAVAKALQAAKQAGAKRCVPLPLSVPSHSTLMKPAAEQLRDYLQDVDMHAPQLEVIQNVDVCSYSGEAEIRDALYRQLFNPVRWVETIQHMVSSGVKVLIELGPGRVLTGFNKRIDRSVTGYSVHDINSFDRTLEQLDALASTGQA